MKKFLSFLLACLMILSLASCGGKDSGDKSDDSKGSRHPSSSAGVENQPDEPSQTPDTPSKTPDTPVEPQKPAVTAESLVSSGYGVGTPKSATLYFSFMIKEGSRSRTINCTHEYDGSYDHMVVTSQVDEDGSEVPMEYEFYYSYADSTVYQLSNGEVVSGTVERFECPLTKVITVPLKVSISNPVLEETDAGYSVEGTCAAQLFNDMLSFVYTDAATFTDDVHFGLLYDKDSLMLTGMAWYATSGITEYQVWAYVDDINSTKIVVGGDSGTTTEPVNPGGDYEYVPSCKDDETLLSILLYNKEFLYEDDVMVALGSKYAWADDDIQFQFRYFCNFYSKEGFLRRMHESNLASEDEQKAAVIVCQLIGEPAETLYRYGYTSKALVETYWNK